MTRRPCALWLVLDRANRAHYLTACKPLRTDGGVEFVGLLVSVVESAGVEGVELRETWPLTRSLPGGDCEFREVSPTMAVSLDVRRQLVDLAGHEPHGLEAA